MREEKRRLGTALMRQAGVHGAKGWHSSMRLSALRNGGRGLGVVRKRREWPRTTLVKVSTIRGFKLLTGWLVGRSFAPSKPELSTIMLDTVELPPSVQQLDSGTLSEHVFRLIQAAIVKGEIAPGSKISEPELARTYGISRGPLREAIHRLEGQKLLVRVPHVGARVVSLSHAELIELYEIRESLEGMACRLAAERMSEAEIDDLRRVLSTHERDEAFQAGVGYYQQEGDFDFHYRIIQGSGESHAGQAAPRRALPACAHVSHPVLDHTEPAAPGLRRTPSNSRRHRRARR